MIYINWIISDVEDVLTICMAMFFIPIIAFIIRTIFKYLFKKPPIAILPFIVLIYFIRNFNLKAVVIMVLICISELIYVFLKDKI